MKVLLWAPTALSALLSLRALAFVAYQGLNGAADPDRTMEEAVAAKPRGAGWGGWLLGLA